MVSKSIILGSEELEIREEYFENEVLSSPVHLVLRRQNSDHSIVRLAGSLFCLTNTYFAAQISTPAAAAIALSAPVLDFFLTIPHSMRTIFFGHYGEAIGMRDQEQAKSLVVQSLFVNVVLVLFLVPLIVWSGSAVATFFGGSGETLDLTVSYFSVMVLCLLPGELSQQLTAMLYARGQTRGVRNLSVVQTVLNFILNCWFVFGGFGVPALGIKGIALSSFFAALLGLVVNAYLVRPYCQFRLNHWSEILPGRETVAISKGAGSVATGSLAYIIGQLIVTRALLAGGSVALAAYGIAGGILSPLSVTAAGIGPSVLSIASQNFGARQVNRIKKCWQIGNGLVVAYLLPAVLLSLLLPELAISIMSNDSSVELSGVLYFQVLAFTEVAYGFSRVAGAVLIGIRLPWYASALDAIQRVVLPAVIIPLSVVVAGPIGVVWGIALSAIIAAVISNSVAYNRLGKAVSDGK